MLRRLALLFVLGCPRPDVPPPAVDAVAAPIEQARARPIPAKLQGRFSFTLKSELMNVAAATGGVVILDRPGNGHVAVLGPLGSPLAMLQTDGAGAALAIARDRRHFVATDAEQMVRNTTGGLVGLDDLLGLFVGDLPLDGAVPRAERIVPLSDGSSLSEVVLDGPEGTTLVVGLDPPSGTPRTLIAKDLDGKVMVEASYAPFAAFQPSGAAAPVWLPTDIDVYLPGMDIDLEIRMKSWSVPDVMPAVFGLAPPEGFTTSPLVGLLTLWADQFAPPTPGTGAGDGSGARMGASEEEGG